MKSNSIIGVGLFFVAISTASVFADNSEDCPPIDPQFKEIYEELKQDERDLLKKIDPRHYSMIYDQVNERSKEIFLTIKKEYPGTPACNGLSSDINFSVLSKEGFDAFLKQYIECSLEHNGVDPKKVNINYDITFFNDEIQNNKNERDRFLLRLRADMGIVSFYSGYVELVETNVDSQLEKLFEVVNNNALIIAVMQDKKALNVALYGLLSQSNQLNKDNSENKRLMRYLWKIKNIIEKAN